MITLKKINLNRPCYFFSNMTNVKNFNPNLLTIVKISYKNTDAVVYNIKYIMMESSNNKNIDSENPLCLTFNNVDAYIIEESNENKYLILSIPILSIVVKSVFQNENKNYSQIYIHACEYEVEYEL